MTSFEITAESSATPERVFDVLADGAGWSRWAGPAIPYSGWAREGTPAPGGVGAIRVLGLPKIGAREEIVEYDRPHRLVYTVLFGLPVKDYRGTITFEPKDAGDAASGGTLIRWRAEFTPLLDITERLVEKFLRATLLGFAKRAAAYAERT